MIGLLNANSLQIPLADKSVQMVATSPPYWGLRDYGISDQLGLEKLHDCLGWATGAPCGECYVCHTVSWAREVRRVLRDDGVFFLNLGDSYATGTTAGRQDGTLNLGGGTNEARKINRVGTPDGLKTKDLVGIPWRVALALQADGWYLRSDIIWAKPNPMPESVTDRPTKAHEYVFLLTKSQRYYWDHEAVRENYQESSLQRFEYRFNGATNPSSQATKNPAVKLDGFRGELPSGRNIRTVWHIATQPYKGAHFATWPPKLVEPMIKAGSREGDIVLDPFAGSGTTLLVARQLGRSGVGLDLSMTYLKENATKRLELDKLKAWTGR